MCIMVEHEHIVEHASVPCTGVRVMLDACECVYVCLSASPAVVCAHLREFIAHHVCVCVAHDDIYHETA